MKKDFHNDVDNENLNIANKILADSENFDFTSFSKPPLEKLIEENNTTSKRSWKKGRLYAVASAMAACLILIAYFGAWYHGVTEKKGCDTQKLAQRYFAADYSEIYNKLMSIRTNTALDEKYAVQENSVVDTLDGAAPDYAGQPTQKMSSAPVDTINSSSNDSSDYYDTNEQTENVHEGDIVKTNGNYIYTLTYLDKKDCYQIIITKVDGTEMNIVKTIDFKKNDSTEMNIEKTIDIKLDVTQSSARSDSYIDMHELYLYENKLIAIGTQYTYLDTYDSVYGYSSSSKTYIYIYDVSQPESATLINTLSQDGSYTSSRMKDNYLYTITEHNIINPTKDYCVPEVNGKLMAPDCIYLPEKIDNDAFTVITGLDVTNAKEFTSSRSILGGSSNVYASLNNIYVINSIYDEDDISDTKEGKSVLKKAAKDGIKIYDNEEIKLNGYFKKCAKQYIKAYDLDVKLKDITAYQDSGAYKTTPRTEIIKFKYNSGNVELISNNKIDGHTEDNLSFDEKDGYLRCVTTEYSDTSVKAPIKCYDKNGTFLFDITEYSEYISSEDETNNVFVLDENLNIAAEINNLAKNESIYSARYLGDYGYFVTYEQTDPLFSVDFSDMENPKIIGELKMPGYSEYLHFYDEDKLFGFGLEESSETELSMLKLEMYNIKNGSAKKETKTLLEDYSYSESMYDYKAMMIDTGKNLIGFTAEEEIITDTDWDYQQYYLVYSYNNKTFNELYKIKINQNSYNVRGLYIDNYLYVVCSEYGIYAIDMDTYNDNNKVEHVKFK